MATSGTISRTRYDAMTLLEQAVRRCKLTVASLSGEELESARNELFLELSSLANNGYPLWCQQKEILPLYEGQNFLETPAGTIDLRNSQIRTTARISGTFSSSDGGTVAFAEDDDFETIFTQTAPDGNFSVAFTTPTQVIAVGLLGAGTNSYDLVFETSPDGLSWTEVGSSGAFESENRAWNWFDCRVTKAANFFRIRETAGGTLSFREIYFGNNTSEIPIARLNVDDYQNLPNKNFQGKPLQFWLDRQREVPVMRLWPAPNYNARYMQIVVLRLRYIQDVGDLSNDVDIPQMYFDAITWNVAARLCTVIERVTPEAKATVVAAASGSTGLAKSASTDVASSKISPNLRPYTS